MKLCIDCKFFEQHSIGFDRCLHPLAQVADRVRGAKVPVFCDLQRSSTGQCGHDAALFEARKETVPV
jgi:hypothetical protein